MKYYGKNWNQYAPKFPGKFLLTKQFLMNNVQAELVFSDTNPKNAIIFNQF